MAARKKKAKARKPKKRARQVHPLAGCDVNDMCRWIQQAAKALRDDTHKNGIDELWKAVIAIEKHLYCNKGLPNDPILATCSTGGGGGGDKAPPPPPPDFPPP